MNRTTVMLPPDLKSRALRRARRRGISLGELIRESLELKLSQKEHATPEDPFLADSAVFRGSTPRDLAENHDEYLYGDRK